ncbi:MAG: ATP-binding protein [Gammaproteobacteria bacterium]|nr:ATP-binding protein [Gammaproteobacteria bacterium]
MTVLQNILQKILTKGTFLSEESVFVLKTELRDVRTYGSILRALAAGNTTMKDLASKLSMDGRMLSSYLNTLQALHQVQREVSLNERAPEKSRKGRYRIADNFLNFWFRFVEPYVTLVELNAGGELLKQKIKPQLNTYMGGIFENICQQYVLYCGQEIGLPLVKRVGRIWDKDFDIDVAAENLEGGYMFGECKWGNLSVNALLPKLQERAGKTGLSLAGARYLLFTSQKVTGESSGSSNFYRVGVKELFPD